MKKKISMLISVILTTSMVLAGCGSSSTSQKSTADNKIKVNMVAMGTYEPYNYLDENNQVAGFDYDVVRAIAAIAPEIEVNYNYTAFEGILPGVDAGKYNLVVSQFNYTDSRNKMYLLAEEPYMVSEQHILTTDKFKNAKSLDDMKGATIATTTGSSQATILENYLKEHPDYFKISYYEGTLEYYLTDVSSGKVDATVEDPSSALKKCTNLHLDNIISVGKSLIDAPVYFIYPKNDEGKKINDIMMKYYKQLLADGTITKIAEKDLGSNQVVTRLNDLGYFKEVKIK